MNLYKVILRFAYNHSREFTFYVVAKDLQDAGDLAIETFKKYDYGDCHLHTTELIAGEGQYARPNILLLVGNSQKQL
ncbi:MAG: hypothetical protein WC974_09920 [Thermoplasmata archaeon]